jgi:hypothetical protein
MKAISKRAGSMQDKWLAQKGGDSTEVLGSGYN